MDVGCHQPHRRPLNSSNVASTKLSIEENFLGGKPLKFNTKVAHLELLIKS